MGIVTAKKARVWSSQIWAYFEAVLLQPGWVGKKPAAEREDMDRKAAGTKAVLTS